VLLRRVLVTVVALLVSSLCHAVLLQVHNKSQALHSEVSVLTSQLEEARKQLEAARVKLVFQHTLQLRLDRVSAKLGEKDDQIAELKGKVDKLVKSLHSERLQSDKVRHGYSAAAYFAEATTQLR